MAPPKGHPRYGGRTKGTKNKVTSEARQVLQLLLDKRLPDLDQMIEDTWHGIEIEKQMPDGSTVVGRLNANPEGAGKLTLAAYKLLHPPPVQVVGEDGGPLQIIVQKYTEPS